ncbi:MAG: hypothetical protein QM642_05365 [Edaphocola sp.]
MQSQSTFSNFMVVLLGILFAVLTRLLPHPANFAPMMAMGIFGGALFRQKLWAFVMPIFTIWLSDLFINNVIYAGYNQGFVWLYEGWYWQYSVYFLVSLASGLMFKNKIGVGRIAAVALGSAVLFYLVSNFGAWAGTDMYPKTSEGLGTCYLMGLPYLKGTLLGNLFYCAVLFGAYYLLENRTAILKQTAKYSWQWI